ncbi:ABC transporter permease [Gryllotalpicola sp.]|uniref:ABC transporter permease n=1 Tax=Gryllotalpicola sp. TaxID=1932787 RepID=UPI0026359C68|nr:ABC transporter permease [Gryllotalpicola sp.]
MTTVAGIPGAVALEKLDTRSWKTPVALGVFALGAVVLFLGLPRDGQADFQFSQSGDFFSIPDLIFTATPVCIGLAFACVLLAAGSFALVWFKRLTPLWYIGIFAALFLVGFLAWAAAGLRPLPLTGLLLGSVSLSIPLVFGSLGGVIGERTGVVNVAIEGQLLGGAFTAALVSSVTGSFTAGLFAAAVAGVLIALILGVFAITYIVEQVVVGVVVNVLVLGLTNFGYSTILTVDPEHLNRSATLPALPIPLLSQIPVIGPALFDQSIIVYVAYVAVPAVWYALFRTKWGLRARSVGEHPEAADTVGINVNRTRYLNLVIAGAIVGFGGAYFTIGSVGSFSQNMTGGQGFIALAAVIFGRWDPVRAAMAALLFGFATNLQNSLGILGSPVPSEFLLMLPYLVTVFAVAGLVGRSQAPAADGKPYIK